MLAVARYSCALLVGVLLVIGRPVHAQVPSAPGAASDPSGRHRLVLQVSDAEPKTWHQALNNARNVQSELGRGNVDIALVVYGNGIGMLKLDSEVSDRIKDAADTGVRVLACENTMKGRKLVREDMLSHIGYVGAGIVEIMRLQRAGYVYIRP